MKRERKGLVFGAFFVIACIVASCRVVKEDRTLCPCTLSLVMESLPEYPAWVYVNGEPAGEAYADTTLKVLVERGPEADILVLSGAPLPPDGMARIPYGAESPAFCSFSTRADCRGETGVVHVKMQRHFSALSLSFESAEGRDLPFWAEVRGCVGGLSLPDGAPLPGEFRCRMDEDFRCRLPRQHESDQLWLDIVMADGVLRSFPLDVSLRASDYDWEAPSLKEISLHVSLSVTEIHFTGGEWGAAFPLQISI